MRKILMSAAAALSIACLAPTPSAFADEEKPLGVGLRAHHRIGLGANYWKTVDNIDEQFDSHGLSYLLTYQYAPVWYFRIEADLELFPDFVGTTKPVLAPEVFLTLGGIVYAGVGTGIYYHDGNWGSAPFYVLRAGLDFPIGPRVFLDVNANYRFEDWGNLELDKDIDTNTVTIGAALRFVM